jgi:hypothetical protein
MLLLRPNSHLVAVQPASPENLRAPYLYISGWAHLFCGRCTSGRRCPKLQVYQAPHMGCGEDQQTYGLERRTRRGTRQTHS